MRLDTKTLLVAFGCAVGLLITNTFVLRNNEADGPVREEVVRTSDKPLLSGEGIGTVHSQAARGVIEDQRSESEVELPFIGRVKAHPEPPKPVSWNGRGGEKITLPFTFWIGENGVWVRAEYRGLGKHYPERAVEELQDYYSGGGQRIVGLPAAESMGIGDALKFVSERLELRDASRIVIDHVLYTYNLVAEPETAIIIKIWGVKNADEEVPDLIPRVRFVIFPKSDFGLQDDLM